MWVWYRWHNQLPSKEWWVKWQCSKLHHWHHLGGGGGGSFQSIFNWLYLGLVTTSWWHIILNSSQHLHHAFLASGALKSFFATEIPTPSKGEHIHHSSSVGGSPCTCFLVNGSQCSHPYLWTRCIPMIGTNTRKNPMTPRHHGVCITDLTRSWTWFILEILR